MDPSSDFRFAYIYATNFGPVKTSTPYPGFTKFSDEGESASKGTLLYYIKPDEIANNQYHWFASNTASGLTQEELSRVNQSIEAFVYCILSAHVNVRSSILGAGGRAIEARKEFLELLEDAIRQPDLETSVQRYQSAVDEAKSRLDLAACLGAWLIPAEMVINTEGVVGYNNQLQQAT